MKSETPCVTLGGVKRAVLTLNAAMGWKTQRRKGAPSR